MQKIKQYGSLFIIILVFLLTSGIFWFYFPEDFKKNFLISFVTFFVGSFVIYLYIKQKIDYKKDAASVILMEIRNAEKIIDSIMDGQIISSNIVLLPTNNWVKNNYLFIDNLDRDELDLVNKFYNQCTRMDESLKQLSIAIQLEQKSDHIQKKLTDIAYATTNPYQNNFTAIELTNTKAVFDIQKNNFLKIIESEGHIVNWDNPRREISITIGRIEKVTTSSAGDKLKKIANLKY